jgi:homoserine dehydrogenase
LKKINIAILGLGNIGTGTYKLLEMNRKHIEQATDIDFQVKWILEKYTELDRGIVVDPKRWTQDPDEIMSDPCVDVVVELLGGIEFSTKLMIDAMNAGKHVVTANKAAVAANFEILTETAEKNGVLFRYEASVGGGIPLINAITTSLVANEWVEFFGILNGTTNFILTKMTEEKLPYDVVLSEAQERGFAEADPTADVEGIDVANKLSILMSIVFGKRVRPEEIPTTGITKITSRDIDDAAKDNCVIKLLASAKKVGDEITCSVEPVLLNKKHPLSEVNDEFNALFLKGNAVDDVMLYGKGAGPLPTASAIWGDVIEIGRSVTNE